MTTIRAVVTHKMTVKQPYFNLIKDGKKTIECRLFDSKRQQINIGDMIEFSNANDKCSKMVVGLFRAKNFHTLFTKINVNDAGFEKIEDAEKALEEFYDLKSQNNIGVIGIVLA